MRVPENQDSYIVRSSAEAIEVMGQPSRPIHVDLDYHLLDYHLGLNDTGLHVVHWMIRRDVELEGQFIPEGFTCASHSSDQRMATIMTRLLTQYVSSRKFLRT